MRKTVKLGCTVIGFLSFFMMFESMQFIEAKQPMLSRSRAHGDVVGATIGVKLDRAAVTSRGNKQPSTSGEDVGKTFKAKCSICHGRDGSGDTRMGKRLMVIDLRSGDVQDRSDEELVGIVAHGKGKMPKYEKRLSEEQIRQLISYIRELAKKP